MDLIAIVALTLLLQPLIYGVPLEPVRIALGLLLVLFFPGYVLISALYPRREQLEGVNRIALGLGLSLALVPLLGLILNFTPWGIRLTPIVLTLSLWTLVLAAVAWLQRRRVMPQERFEIRWAPVAAWIRKPRRPVDLIVGLSLTLAVLAVIGAVAWRIQLPTPGESFTEFYVSGAQGMLQDYPTTLQVGEAQDYNVGIVNQERETVTYTIRAVLGDTQVGSIASLTLNDRDGWEGKISVTPTTAGDQQKLELRLYRDAGSEVYRSVHLFVDVSQP
ncbi:MAG: DUF1616 domain-containing protein [Dehalococcoidia bacterium]